MQTKLAILILVCGAGLLVGCTHNPATSAGTADQSTHPALEQALGTSPPTMPAATATPATSATPTLIATATRTPTPAPTPTSTPLAGQRLAAARQAYEWGDYGHAADEAAAVLADVGATTAERQEAALGLGRSQLEAGDYAKAVAALQQYVATYPTDVQVAAAHFMTARAYAGLGDWRNTIAAYRRYLKADGTLALYAYDGIAQAAVSGLDYEQAIQAYNDGLGVAANASWQARLREGIAQAELARNNPAGAVQQYDAILSVARIDAYRAKILYLAGQALVQAGNSKAARQRYLEAVTNYPAERYAYQSLIELVNTGAAVDDYQRGLVDYYAGAYQPAVDALTRAVAADANLKNGDGQWYLALSLKGSGDLARAIQRLQKYIQAYSHGSHLSDAWLETADAHASNGDTAQALRTYRRFASQYPASPMAVTALWQAAGLEEDAGDRKAAAASYRDLAARYPQADQAPQALFNAALLDYRRSDARAAQTGWQALLDKYPNSQWASGARFWLGKAWQVLGKLDQAEAAFQTASQRTPDTYYGLRAAELLAGTQTPAPTQSPTTAALDPPPAITTSAASQAEADRWLAGWLPTPVPPQEGITRTGSISISGLLPAIAEDGAWRRGNALMAAGSRREALEEFEKVKDAWWDDPVAMYQLAIAWRASSAYRLSVLCADRLYRLSPTARRAQLPLLIQQLTHPIYFEPLVVAQAQAQQIDPLLLFALIRQESLFEPSATSSADARGLAQVIPDTGEWIAGRLKWSGWQPEDLWRPYISVEFGAWYLAVQLAAFDGQVMPALAAYNAGPGNVQKWLAATPDLDLFAETMAFSEPRRYVRSIYEGYYTYRRLYRP